MLPNHTAILHAAIFIGVLLLVQGAFLLVRDVRAGPQAQINRRLRMLAESREAHEVLASLRRERRGGGRAIALVPLLGQLDRLLVQAGCAVAPGRVLAIMALLAVAGFAALRLFLQVPPLLALPTAAALGMALPVLFLVQRRRKRMQAFEEQLPGAIDLLVRSLRVGHPFSSALAVVAREMPDPLGSEFGIVVDEVTYGQELEEALERMNERVDLQDLRYLTVAVQIQHASGGNLAEILAGLAKVIRDRFHMFRKVKAITAEGRWSAWFLSLFPIFMVIGVQLVKPDYYTQVADHPLFGILAGVTAVLLVVNIIFMRVLTTIKV